MPHHSNTMSRVKCAGTIAMGWGLAAGVSLVSMFAVPSPSDASVGPSTAATVPVASKERLDRSGRTQIGKASFYADRYAGKTMADGTPMRSSGNNAASVTLPLGTTARVTNLETGRSALVVIRDKGPYVRGRIIDLSPATARKIGLERRQGLATVRVAPLSVPLADGTIKIVSNRRITPPNDM